MRFSLPMAAALVLLSVPALASDPAPAPAAPVASETPAPVEKMICRAQMETGSLVKKMKRCYTKKQWRYVNDKSQEHIDRLQMDNATRQSGEGSTFSGG